MGLDPFYRNHHVTWDLKHLSNPHAKEFEDRMAFIFRCARIWSSLGGIRLRIFIFNVFLVYFLNGQVSKLLIFQYFCQGRSGRLRTGRWSGLGCGACRVGLRPEAVSTAKGRVKVGRWHLGHEMTWQFWTLFFLFNCKGLIFFGQLYHFGISSGFQKPTFVVSPFNHL